MTEPTLPTAIVDGDSGHETHHDVLHVWHNHWISQDGSRVYIPADLVGLGPATGAPTTGAHVATEIAVARDGHIWLCTVDGTPGTWVDITTSGGGGGGGSITPVHANNTATASNGTSIIADPSSRSFADLVTINASPNISSPAGAQFVQADVGRAIVGTGVPANTKILSVSSGTAAVMTANATAGGSSIHATIGGAFTITSPAATSGYFFEVKKFDIGPNLVTVTFASGTLETGETTDVLGMPYQSVGYRADGTNWVRV